MKRTVFWRIGAEDRHLLLFWPLFFLIFTYAEKGFPAAHYHVMHCWLDDRIPFCVWAVLPYLLWFPFVGGMLLLTFLWDRLAFRRMMRFIILTYSAALLCFFLFPTCQQLRPPHLIGSALPVRLVSAVYGADTNTNVCPSIHVIGSLAVWLAARDTKTLPAFARRWLIPMLAVSVCASTVLLKQHSVLDVLAALAVSGAGRYIVCRAPVTVARPLRTRSTV